MTYTRISDNLYDSSLWSDGSYEGVCALKAFIAILGEVRTRQGRFTRLTPAKLARIAAIPIEMAERAIEILTGPDDRDSSGIAEGRRLVPDPEGAPNDYLVTNWESYGRLFRRASKTEYQRRWRQRRRAAQVGDVDKSIYTSSTCRHPVGQEEKKRRREETTTGAEAAPGKPRRRSQRQIAIDEILATIDQKRPGTAANATRSAWEKLLTEFGAEGLHNAVASVDDWAVVENPVAFLRAVCKGQLDRGRRAGGDDKPVVRW